MSRNREKALSFGLFLVGVGVLFLVPSIPIWPLILVVMAISGLPTALARGWNWLAWQSTVWLIGLAVLFALDLLWPGVLVLFGLSVLMRGLASRDRSEEQSASLEVATPWSDMAERPLDLDEPLLDEPAPAPLSGEGLSADKPTGPRDTERL